MILPQEHVAIEIAVPRSSFVLVRKISTFNYISHTVWKNEEFSLTKKIFRQINFLVTYLAYLVKPLLSRKFCQNIMEMGE